MSRVLALAAAALIIFSSSLFASEDFRIRIVNTKGGGIFVSRNQGASFEAIGNVVYPANKVNIDGFTASEWAGSSEVAATSVNAIHIKASDPKTIFSILPREFLEEKSGYNSYFSKSSSIITDIGASRQIFGGSFSPFVGDKVFVNGKKIIRPLKDKDVLTITVDRPDEWPSYIVFENIYGGRILSYNSIGKGEVIGEVIKPVYGVGRFEGGIFLPPGRIRANHPGVIDVSVSPNGMVGGFQIIPAHHAQSREMKGVYTWPQWMIVKLSTGEGSGEPLFKHFLKPQYDESDLYAEDWDARLLKRFLVDVKLKDKEGWRPVPVYGLVPQEDLPRDALNFLEDVEKIRIVFPPL